MANPTQVHWIAMMHVLCFLLGTPNHGILLRRMIGQGITVYCDTDWGGGTTNRKSRTCFLIYVGGRLDSWSSQKQETVASSSTKAE